MKAEPPRADKEVPRPNEAQPGRGGILKPRKTRKLKAGPEKTSEPAPQKEPAAVKDRLTEAPTEGEHSGPKEGSRRTWRAEFSTSIGSFAEARRSMIVGYLLMVLAPTVILLAMTSILWDSNTAGARGFIDSMNRMLEIVAVMGIPMMVVSWVNGYYPKGSYGRLAAGVLLAALLTVWLVLLLLGSDLEGAFAASGADIELDMILVLSCMSSFFIYARAVAEFADSRKAWKKSAGEEVETAALNLDSGFLDVNPQIGKFQGGNVAAVLAYFQFMFVPTAGLVAADWVLRVARLRDEAALLDSFSDMFGAVLLFGMPLVIIHFVRGFYPSGSMGRVIAGLMSVSVLSLYAWSVVLGSGIEEALGRNYVIIDMYSVLLPLLMYVLFIAIFQLAELVDNRRSWHREIGLPVRPLIPEEKYRPYHDFKFRYASFKDGAKKGRKVLDKYAFFRILLLILAEAAIVSLYQYSGWPQITELIKSLLSDATLSSHMDFHQTIYTLVLLAILTTAGMFMAWSYREGSYSRMILSGVVAVFASLWAYVFWGSIADGIESFYLAWGFRAIMILSIARSLYRAEQEIRGGYQKNRSTYLGWRSNMLIKEAPVNKFPVPPNIPATPVAATEPAKG